MENYNLKRKISCGPSVNPDLLRRTIGTESCDSSDRQGRKNSGGGGRRIPARCHRGGGEQAYAAAGYHR